jgi:restriction endonuclease S subunit
MIRLKDIITSIKYGPHYRTEKDGNAKYLKGNQFDEDYELTLFSNSYVNISQEDSNHLLKENDVILAAKGFRNFAWKHTTDYGECVASSLFYVIKLNEEIIQPDYFTMAINSPRIQHRLKNVGLGATIPAIPKNELLRIKISVPPIEEQKKAIEVYQSLNKQIRIEREILEKRLRIKNGLLNLLTENHE